MVAVVLKLQSSSRPDWGLRQKYDVVAWRRKRKKGKGVSMDARWVFMLDGCSSRRARQQWARSQSMLPHRPEQCTRHNGLTIILLE